MCPCGRDPRPCGRSVTRLHVGAMDDARHPTADVPRWYVALWSVIACVFVVCGTLVPVAAYGLWRVAVVFVFLSAIVGGCGLAWSLAIGLSWRRAVATGLGSGAFVTASWGMVEVFGPWSLLGVAVVTALAPSTIRLWRRTFPRRDGGATRDVPPWTAPLVADHDLPRMTLPDLCRFWCSSEAELDTEPVVTRTLQLVRQRAICLDQMEQRQPGAFAQWLTTGALTTDPRRFLQTTGEPPSTDAE